MSFFCSIICHLNFLNGLDFSEQLRTADFNDVLSIYSTSRKTKAPTALIQWIIRALFAGVTDNKLLNEFSMTVLQDVYEWQGLRALLFTSIDP